MAGFCVFIVIYSYLFIMSFKSKKILLMSLIVLALFSTLAAARDIYQPRQKGESMTSQMQIPPGWTVFRGENPDLIVMHPKEWEVEQGAGGAFLAIRPGSDGAATALVVVQPIKEIGRSSKTVVAGLSQIFPDLFPDVEIIDNRIVSKDPDVAVASLRFMPSGQPFQGTAMFFKQGEDGVLYAIAASKKSWKNTEPVMKQILSSFFYSQPVARTEPTLPNMVQWRDPIEGAFTLPVPSGWNVQGGLKRFSAVDVRPEVLATSPDGNIVIRIGDSYIPPMRLPGEMMRSFGFYEGSWYSADGITQHLVMRYLPGARFITDFYLPNRLGNVSNVQVNDLPELSRKAEALWKQAGIAAKVDAGEITFETQSEQGLRKGYAFAQTALNPLPGMPADEALWFVERFFGYLSAPSAEPAAQAILNRMVTGYKTDPAWHAQSMRMLGQVSEIVSQTNREIAGIISDTFNRKWESEDRIHERRIRAIRGQILIEDPATGERFEVPSGSNYYWRLEGRQDFIGTESPQRPYDPNYWLQEMRGLD
jgi:hypothetical protein